jgi:hypothetical protein
VVRQPPSDRLQHRLPGAGVGDRGAALGSAIGVRLTGVLAAVVSTVLFERLAAG